jgi:Prenyltransferase and squalene oxidase repeat
MRKTLLYPRTGVRGFFFPALLGLAVLAALVLGKPAHAVQPQTSVAAGAIAYIEAHQNADGGFPDFGSSSSAGSALDAVFALKSAGMNPASVTNGGNSPVNFLQAQASSYSGTAGGAAKLALGVGELGLNQANFGSVNLLTAMQSNYNNGTGAYGSDNFSEAFYLLALKAGNQPIPPLAVTYLESLQLGNGSWEFCCGFGGDTNTTALVMQALVAAGVSPASAPITNALAYLATTQQADGGFGYDAFSSTDPSSTAFVIQALLAATQDIDPVGPWAPSGNTPMGALVASFNSGTGAFIYFGSDSIFSTYQAIPAVEMAPFVSLAPTPDGCTGFNPPWGRQFDDVDCDGFSGSTSFASRGTEAFIGTSASVRCAATPATNDEPNPDSWPVDYNDDQLAGGADILKFGPVFNSHSPTPPYSVRFDLNNDGAIGGADILKFGPFFNKRCA